MRGGWYLGVAEVTEHVAKMLQLENWNLIENRFTRNISNARKFKITTRYLPWDFASISGKIFKTFLQVPFDVFFLQNRGGSKPPTLPHLSLPPKMESVNVYFFITTWTFLYWWCTIPCLAVFSEFWTVFTAILRLWVITQSIASPCALRLSTCNTAIAPRSPVAVTSIHYKWYQRNTRNTTSTSLFLYWWIYFAVTLT